MKTFADFAKLKRFFLSICIGSLILAALAAVVTVLFGQVDELMIRVFMTLALVVIHSFVALAFIWDDSRRNTFYSLAFFMNIVFLLIILSFITSIFGVWKIFGPQTVLRIYESFLFIGFAGLHVDLLLKAMHRESYLDGIVKANFVLIVLVLGLILGHIHADTLHVTLGSFYYRLLAALSIVDGTLSLLAIIFFKLYMHKHPEVQVQLQTGAQGAPAIHISIWVWILGIFLLFQTIQMFSLVFRQSFGF